MLVLPLLTTKKEEIGSSSTSDNCVNNDGRINSSLKINGAKGSKHEGNKVIKVTHEWVFCFKEIIRGLCAIYLKNKYLVEACV